MGPFVEMIKLPTARTPIGFRSISRLILLEIVAAIVIVLLLAVIILPGPIVELIRNSQGEQDAISTANAEKTTQSADLAAIRSVVAQKIANLQKIAADGKSHKFDTRQLDLPSAPRVLNIAYSQDEKGKVTVIVNFEHDDYRYSLGMVTCDTNKCTDSGEAWSHTHYNGGARLFNLPEPLGTDPAPTNILRF